MVFHWCLYNNIVYFSSLKTESILEVKGISSQDICSRKNTVDLFPFSDKPAFTTYPQNQTVREGDNVTLFCNATGNPRPSISWTIDELTVNITVYSRISLTSDNKQLTVKNVSRTDSHHKYRCQANNSVGTITSDPASLTVQCEYDSLTLYSYIIYYDGFCSSILII